MPYAACEFSRCSIASRVPTTLHRQPRNLARGPMQGALAAPHAIQLSHKFMRHGPSCVKWQTDLHHYWHNSRLQVLPHRYRAHVDLRLHACCCRLCRLRCLRSTASQHSV